MSNDDIAARGGIARSTVAKISKLNRWDSLTLAMVEKFAKGCAFDLDAPHKSIKSMRWGVQSYQDRMSSAQRRMCKRLIEALRVGPRAHAAAQAVQTG